MHGRILVYGGFGGYGRQTAQLFADSLEGALSAAETQPSPRRPCLTAQHGERLDSEINYDRDFDYDYFGFKVRGASWVCCTAGGHRWTGSRSLALPLDATQTHQTLERSYLLRIHNKIIERPQHMLMRVAGALAARCSGAATCIWCCCRKGPAVGRLAPASRLGQCVAVPAADPSPPLARLPTPSPVGIHLGDIDAAVRTYHMLSERWFTHASPTLFNAGTPRPQLSSCFLVCSKGDSIEGIYDTLKECAVISKSAGGIGVSIHNIRATGSYIRGTNGTSNGIVPMLRVFNDTAR